MARRIESTATTVRPRKRPVTIKDVAAHLGVSFSAVSRALNDRHHTSEDMKARVRDAAKALGYVPHTAARMMHRAHSQTIGLVLPDLSNYIFAETASVMAEQCYQAGYQLVLGVSQRDPQIELEQVESMRAMRVAGVIISPCGQSLPETHRLLASMPSVQLARRNAELKIPTIATDDRTGSRNAMRHLLQLGHSRVALVSGDQTMTDKERLEGALDALSQAGVEQPSGLVLQGPLTAEFGREATSRVVQMEHRPTAVLCTNSVLTIGVVDAVQRAGLSVPGEMSLIGYGDPEWFRLWGPGLTTVQLPITELAQACAMHLLRQVGEGGEHEAARRPFEMMLDTSLLLRGSTGPAPGNS
ncbi:LacI family transcriptional regulator [Sphingomonas sp. MG17]|uniref:LacI family transcriptional regulator n=1 Tax=Sphingomonas tagetis TaxID=2949092 RepID=A0A9X2HRF4_9SPHN|nr:LacI family DNA-binding transcriptional regulator [Sphingomonas tagetis]MCP3731225.1 LacI family transcriptional regulator [Sphingomonas tagetis]